MAAEPAPMAAGRRAASPAVPAGAPRTGRGAAALLLAPRRRAGAAAPAAGGPGRAATTGVAARLRGVACAAVAALVALCPGSAPEAQSPMSAIDWLSRSVDEPASPRGSESEAAAGPGVTDRDGQVGMPLLPPARAPVSLFPDAITVTPLDAPTVDAVGLFPAARAGLPRDLWGPSLSADLAAQIARLGPDTLPALQELTLVLLLAELDPPGDAEGRGALFLARLDRLAVFGALDQALALIEAAGPADDPELFARWFDLSLLAGDAAPGCMVLRARPSLAAAHPLAPAVRIYCLARGGDWQAAEALLDGPEAAGLTEELRRALARFIDPDADHEAERIAGDATAGRISPLLWQLLDALGEAPPTAALPLAFAHADLGPAAGWKAQIEAAERLTRSGALTPNRLLGLYTERAPAASGGVWERVRALQQLEGALLAGSAAGVADVLPAAWALMVEAELEVAFSALYAERLLRLELQPEAAALAVRAGLLTDAAAAVAAAQRPAAGPADRRAAFVAAVATGRLQPDDPRPSGAMAEAIAVGLTAPPDDAVAAALADRGRGAVLLDALVLMQGGGAGDPHAVAGALSHLRAAGQEAVARRAALQILLLDRRG